MTPAAWVETARVSTARRLLDKGRNAPKRVAVQCGFANADTLRRCCPLCSRLCCKSRFALVIKKSAGCRRDFRLRMWDGSSPHVRLTGEFSNAIDVM